jgi:hypothetical protein
MAKIAILGWGSLVWDPRKLTLKKKIVHKHAKNSWNKDGPKLPIEFARVSEDGRLTLVITPEAKPLTTLWAYSAFGSLDQAKENLGEREGTIISNIGSLKKDESPKNDIEKIISKWLKKKDIEAVVWTALPPKDRYGENRVMDASEAISYLKSLTGQEREKAKNYIEYAPEQIHTRIRTRIEEEFGWYKNQNTEKNDDYLFSNLVTITTVLVALIIFLVSLIPKITQSLTCILSNATTTLTLAPLLLIIFALILRYPGFKLSLRSLFSWSFLLIAMIIEILIILTFTCKPV